MNYELLAIQATVKAAELQAEATVWAAVVGGIAIGMGLFISWFTALHIQKVNRLTEIRRDVYLDLVDSYSDMVTGFHTLLLDFDKNWPNQINSIMKVSKNIDKASFVCETITKAKIFEFIKLFNATYLNLKDVVKPIIKNMEELNKLKNKYNEIYLRKSNAHSELDKINMEGLDPLKIEHIINYLKEQSDREKSIIPLISSKEHQLRLLIIAIQPFISNIIDELNEEVIPISHLLRKELGAKTNVNLDIETQNALNKL